MPPAPSTPATGTIPALASIRISLISTAPYSIKVVSATNQEAPYVLDGLLHHGTLLKIDTHYTDTGGASDHVFILCALLGFRFCPRLRDLPIEGSVCSPIFSASHVRSECRGRAMVPLSGARIKSDARPPMI